MNFFQWGSLKFKEIATGGVILALSLILAEFVAGWLYKYVTPLMGRRVIGLITGKHTDKEDFQPRFQKHPYMLYANTVN